MVTTNMYVCIYIYLLLFFNCSPCFQSLINGQLQFTLVCMRLAISIGMSTDIDLNQTLKNYQQALLNAFMIYGTFINNYLSENP